jgi:hypothetical protein
MSSLLLVNDAPTLPNPHNLPHTRILPIVPSHEPIRQNRRRRRSRGLLSQCDQTFRFLDVYIIQSARATLPRQFVSGWGVLASTSFSLFFVETSSRVEPGKLGTWNLESNDFVQKSRCTYPDKTPKQLLTSRLIYLCRGNHDHGA